MGNDMRLGRIDRRRMAIAVASSVIAIGALAACGSSGQQSPTSTTTTTTTTSPTSAAPAAPTEKNINPTEGNLFTPGVTAPAAPGVVPGQHPGINGVP